MMAPFLPLIMCV